MINIEPLFFHLLVRVAKEEKKVGSIIIASQNHERTQYADVHGEVLKIGKTAFVDYGDADAVKVGDIVVFPRYSGMEYTADEEPGVLYRVLRDEDVKAIVLKKS